MKTKRNLIQIYLLGAALLLPAVTQAQFTFTTNNGAITITGYRGTNNVVVIPSATNGWPVTSIGNDAFFNGQSIYSRLTSITIPNSVTNIGDEAFAQCGGLTNITIGTNVISIGTDAFQGCSGLTNIAIPASVTNIGPLAFLACNHLLSITVDTNNPVYSSRAGALFDKSQAMFIVCPGAKAGSYSVPDTVTSIANWAFGNCANLTSIAIPAGVTNIGMEAFKYCTHLTAITVDTNNPAYASIAGILFNWNQSVLLQYPEGIAGSYLVPDSVTGISDEAFYNCTDLTNVTIPASVTSIGNSAFANCSKLISATLPNNLTNIGADAFYECTSLANSLTIPNSVTYIGDNAFVFCTNLTSVTIGNGVTAVRNYVFQFCSGLTNVTIGNNVTSIGMLAFEGCYKLTSVTIPNTVTNIGYEAFQNFHLNSIFFLGNAPAVDSSAFSYDAATAYYLPGTTGWENFAATTGIPIALWFIPNPLILNQSPSFGVKSNQFGFTISWATNIPVVVEACTNFVNAVWQPVATNTLTGGTAYFSDPQWTNYPGRFYRIRSP